jgi:threonine dehydrogenase-like Zn-dependent dehydrogenase
MGVYAGSPRKLPLDAAMNKGLTLKTGQMLANARYAACWNTSNAATSTRRSLLHIASRWTKPWAPTGC